VFEGHFLVVVGVFQGAVHRFGFEGADLLFMVEQVMDLLGVH
jgi:hypothetical protein